jgi:hypothetical protein
MESAALAGVTTTVAAECLVVSAVLVAVTVTLVLLFTAGAVNMPPPETAPAVEDQVTAVLLVPCTVAANCWVLPDATLALFGETATLTVGAEGVTVTVALEVFVVSARLLAVTVTFVELVTAGAVNIPPLETDPAVEDHPTAVLLVPNTVAANC